MCLFIAKPNLKPTFYSIGYLLRFTDELSAPRKNTSKEKITKYIH